MYYVYIIKSLIFPNQSYIGFSRNLKQRIQEHNSGKSFHTAKYKPWEIEAYFAFKKEKTALEFEKYLKSQSGRNFTKKRIC